MLTTTLALTLFLAGPAQPKEIRWETRLDRALAKAQESGKPVMVGFWTEWCGLCRRLDNTTYVDPQVVAGAQRFVTVKIDTEGGDRQREVRRRYRVGVLPTILFLSPGGLQVGRVNSFIGPGLLPNVMSQAEEAARRVGSWESRLAEDPADPLALAALGVHLFQQECYDESAGYLARAIEHDANRPLAERQQTRLLLGLLRTAWNQFADAEGLIKEALELGPSDEDRPKLLFVLSRTYVSWGRHERGIETLQVIVEQHPGSPMADKAREALVSLGGK